MRQKEFILINKGMRRDLSVSKAGESSAYENRNVRITAVDKDTLLSVTNERGNRDSGAVFEGELVGYGVLNNFVVLFTADGETSRIYRAELDGDAFRTIPIFSGNLGFSAGHPLETLVDYETEDVQKIYWLDGVHVLRFMNFSDTNLRKHLASGDLYDNPVFDFADDATWFDSDRPAAGMPAVTLEKDNGGNSRANGVAQYFMTYYNKNGQQTGIVWSSPLVYLAPEGRGGAADGSNNNRVTITASGLDGTFDYARLYMTVRTSLDGQTVGYIVGESSVTEGRVLFVDDGSHLETADPASFIFLGTADVVAGTMTQKDGTLFLGNLKSVGQAGVQDLEIAIKAGAFLVSGESFKYGRDWESAIVSFAYSSSKDLADRKCHLPYVHADGYYPYESQLGYTSAQISTFKGGEKYRFALRFIDGKGAMSKSFWVGDKVNPYYPKMLNDDIINRVIAVCEVPDSVLKAAAATGYTSVQLMVAQATYSDRSVKAQGIVSPTMFNLRNRTFGLTYAQSSWMYRMRGCNVPSMHLNVLSKSNSPSAEMQCSWWPDDSTTPSALYYTDDSGLIVPEPYGYAKYAALKIIVYITAFKGGSKNAFVTFCAYYYKQESDTDAAKSYIVSISASGWTWSWRQRKDKIVAKWLSAYESANIPAAFRADTNLMYSKLDEAMDKATLYKSYTLTYTNPDGDGKIKLVYTASDNAHLYANLNREYYFVDESIATLNSPEISYGAVSLDRNSGLKFRIVGVARMTANISDFSVDVTNGEYPSGPNMPCMLSNANISDNCEGLSAWPLIAEYGYVKNSSGEYEQVHAPYAYMAYMWQKTGSVPAFGTDDTQWSKLSKKIVANLRYSHWTVYNGYKDGSWDITPSDVRQLSDFGAKLYEIKTGSSTVTYAGNVDELVVMPDDTTYPICCSMQEASRDELLQLEMRKEVSDPVHVSYHSGAHAVISLPKNGRKDTILPYMRDDEQFTFGDEEPSVDGPYAPWTVSSSQDSQTLLYRSVDATNADSVKDLKVGSFGPFTAFDENDRMRWKASASDLGTKVCDDFNRMLKYIAEKYPGTSVYACIRDKEDSVLLVDVSDAEVVSVTVSLTMSSVSDSVYIKVSSTEVISMIECNMYGSDRQMIYTHKITEVNRKEHTTVYSKTDFYGGKTLGLVIWFTDTSYFLNYALLADSERFSIGKGEQEYTYDVGIVLGNRYIDPTANTRKMEFIEISQGAKRVFELSEEHVMTYTGMYSSEYPKPHQSQFVLRDKSLITDDCPYLYIGELYHDFDAESEGNPELDTRYGGISENAVEGNTFVEAGSRTSLAETEDVETYATVKIDCKTLYDYINNESTLESSDFKLPIELSNKNSKTETIVLSNLNSIGIANMLPTQYNKCTRLSVEKDTDGNWRSVINGMSESRASLIADDSRYVVAIMRNGYARRGKWRKYINKYGEEQTTHTYRDSRYKRCRCGYSNGLPAQRMRIIGYDLMICNIDIAKMKENSCTWTAASNNDRIDYNKATLISSLGDSLSLPRPTEYNITRDGRFSSRASHDLVELFIGLYHYEEGEWELVSNIVQVRGRSHSNTKIWEFDKENIVQDTA